MGERPSWKDAKEALKTLKRQVNDAVINKRDVDGALTSDQVKMAEQALSEIEAVLTLMNCPQQLSPYRR
jgi:ribosome recycling factor